MDNTTACTDSATCPCNDNGICQCDEGYTGDKCNQCLVAYFDNTGNATNTPNCTGKLDSLLIVYLFCGPYQFCFLRLFSIIIKKPRRQMQTGLF